MPIYEYACPHCGRTFEEWVAHAVSDGDDVGQTCPNCGHRAQRILSNTTFILKGGGWYETDYGKKKEGEHHPAAQPVTAASAEGESKSADKDDKSAPDSSQPAAPAKAAEASSSESPKTEKKTEAAKMPPPASSAGKPAAGSAR